MYNMTEIGASSPVKGKGSCTKYYATYNVTTFPGRYLLTKCLFSIVANWKVKFASANFAVKKIEI